MRTQVTGFEELKIQNEKEIHILVKSASNHEN